MVGFMVYLCQIINPAMKELFSMTRHERIGTIVILVAIALLLAGTVAVRSCQAHQEIPADVAGVNDFELEADSAMAAFKSHEGQTTRKRDKAKKPHKPRSAKKKNKPHSKPDPAPHKMDPVPQF